MSGHPDFVKLTEDEIRLHEEKNADYAGGGDPLGNFKRVAAVLAPYHLDLGDPTVVALVYMMKQLDAALWLISRETDGAVETVDTRLRDVHVYAKLARILRAEGRQGVPIDTADWADVRCPSCWVLCVFPKDAAQFECVWCGATYPVVAKKGVPSAEPSEAREESRFEQWSGVGGSGGVEVAGQGQECDLPGNWSRRLSYGVEGKQAADVPECVVCGRRGCGVTEAVERVVRDGFYDDWRAL